MFKRTLLHGLLVACFAFMPLGISGFANDSTPQLGDDARIEKAAGFRFGVYAGPPAYYYYRPYYYNYYPYPYYYQYYYYYPHQHSYYDGW